MIMDYRKSQLQIQSCNQFLLKQNKMTINIKMIATRKTRLFLKIVDNNFIPMNTFTSFKWVCVALGLFLQISIVRAQYTPIEPPQFHIESITSGNADALNLYQEVIPGKKPTSIFIEGFGLVKAHLRKSTRIYQFF